MISDIIHYEFSRFRWYSRKSFGIRIRLSTWWMESFGEKWNWSDTNNVRFFAKECVKLRLNSSGGQSNLIYMASCKNSKKLSSDTPECFLIRIHCQPSSQVFNDTVIFSVMSERGLGPKLYGFFPGGRLEEYLPSRTLDTDSIKLPE